VSKAIRSAAAATHSPNLRQYPIEPEALGDYGRNLRGAGGDHALQTDIIRIDSWLAIELHLFQDQCRKSDCQMRRDALHIMEVHCASRRYLSLLFRKCALLLAVADGEYRKQHTYVHIETSHEIESAVDPCAPSRLQAFALTVR
jgi:hypothetical protein